MYNVGETLEDFYKHVHLDETRRKFLEGLKEGREYDHVKENNTVIKKELNWGIQLVKKHEIRSL